MLHIPRWHDVSTSSCLHYVQRCGISIANALETLQSCTKPSNLCILLKKKCTYHDGTTCRHRMTVVSPLLTHWTYHSLAPSHRTRVNLCFTYPDVHDVTLSCRIFIVVPASSSSLTSTRSVTAADGAPSSAYPWVRLWERWSPCGNTALKTTATGYWCVAVVVNNWHHMAALVFQTCHWMAIGQSIKSKL